MVGMLRAHAAVGDCEQVRPGLIGQPINTVTSVAYVVAATWVHRRGSRRRTLWAVVLTFVGLGSVAYHGPGTRAGKAIHDAANLAVGGNDRWRRRPPRPVRDAAVAPAGRDRRHRDRCARRDAHGIAGVPSQQRVAGPRAVAHPVCDRTRRRGPRATTGAADALCDRSDLRAARDRTRPRLPPHSDRRGPRRCAARRALACSS